jgi:ribosome-associated protein
MQYMQKAEMFRSWMEEKSVKDIEIIDISKISSDMDAFVIGTALNDRHAKSVADFLEEKAEENGFNALSKEGAGNGKWILLDYIDVIVHLFLEEERQRFNLEKLWADGKFVHRGEYAKNTGSEE